MNSEIFTNWFKNTFIPEVKKFQNLIGKTGKVLLLIDNAPSHPSAACLNEIDETVEVRFLPPNVTPLIQPMDQGVIENLKRLYRKQLLRYLLLSEDQSVQSVFDFYRKMTLKDCCYMIADSWSSIKQFTLRSSWNNIFDHRQLNAMPGLSDAGEEMEELLEALKAVSLSNECENADVEMWLACDSDDPGFQILDDDEIVESILNVEDEMEQDLDEGAEAQTTYPSHDTASRCLEIALEWFECQEECDPAKLLCLKNIRDLAATKRTTTLRQTSITDFFKQKQ
ncbi:hypothetical protein M513_08472 [Trichuris suis]|uniref:DDE-1 domain-containing protein n=1 Tax=Trichuris suis TaxID=68888 RepID=A0A085M0B9_9BILA|nr:hypothetical protein M513_08472 [Trichuris suis]